MRVSIFILMLWTFAASAQDTTQMLTYDQFMEQVKEYHPMVYRSNLISEAGEASLLRSRGGFDPYLYGSADQKYFSDKQYYSNLSGGLKVPTWFGLSAEFGYDKNDGDYVNPMDRVPDAGLWYAGLRLELGNGLIIDKRRAELNKAKIYAQASQIEQKQMLNDLLMTASEAYWKWVTTYHKSEVYAVATENAKFRFEGVKQSAGLGDRPYIDTVESWIQWQNRSVGYQEAKLNYLNAKEYMEVFLWGEDFIPLEIDHMTPPELIHLEIELLSEEDKDVMDSIALNHPAMQLGRYKLDQVHIDLKYKKEQLKPKLTLKYNALSEPVGGNPFTQYNINNYKWGGTFAYPILTRKERGEVKLGKIKVQEQEFALLSKSAEIDYKVKAAHNSLVISRSQLATYESIVYNYEVMYTAELKLFGLGESSVFMVNSREKALLDSQLKQVDLVYDCQMATARFKYVLLNLD